MSRPVVFRRGRLVLRLSGAYLRPVRLLGACLRVALMGLWVCRRGLGGLGSCWPFGCSRFLVCRSGRWLVSLLGFDGS